VKYVTVAEMIAIEKESDANGHTYPEMMENAGKGLAEVLQSAYGHLSDKCALGLVGSGNNGGDALVAFAYLQEWGWRTTAYIVKPRQDDDALIDRLKKSGGEILYRDGNPGDPKLKTLLNSHPVLIDGVLGTGLRLPLRASVGEILAEVKTILSELIRLPHIVAVDCPSGIDCDSGEAAPECIPADITVTMAAVKQGLLKLPAWGLVGDLRCVGIGVPEGLESYDKINREVIDRKWVQDVLPVRPLDSHKGTFGVVMVVAGSVNYSGAVMLAGEAAFRSGAGWVTLAVPEPLHAALAGSFIEATWLPLQHENGWIASQASSTVLNNLERVTTMLIGPGFGMEKTTQDFLSALLKDGRGALPQLVVDADGLKILASIPDWPARLAAQTVLTPHPGEMAELTNLSIELIQSDRLSLAEAYAKEWGHVVVLKGAFTVIASPDGRTAIIPVATPALARAGTGDVLAGLITGFRAQGMMAFEAATAAAFIHAQAGLRAAEILGSSAVVLAGDVLSAVVDVIADFPVS